MRLLENRRVNMLTAAKHLLLFSALPALLSCAQFRSASEERCVLDFRAETGNPPQRVVILPFAGAANDAALGRLVRTSFYNHFSSKTFRDIELSEADVRLKELEAAGGTAWEAMPPSEIGAFLHADYIVYGEVESLEKKFWIFYSQEALSVSAKMLEAGSGRVVWEKKVTRRSHSGDIPLGPLDFFTIIARARKNISEESTIDLVDRTCRELVDNIPDPSVELWASNSVDIQLCSFKSQKSALAIKKELCRKGYRIRIERALVKRKSFYRVMVGPYSSRIEAKRVEGMFAVDHRFTPVLVTHNISKT